MDIFLPKGFQPSNRAHLSANKRSRQLSVQAGGVLYPVLERWEGGFAVDADRVPVLNGPVDLFDGSERIAQYLIVGCATADGARSFRIKRAGPVNYAAAPEMDQDHVIRSPDN